VYDNKVYDGTNYLLSYPGGFDEIKNYCGTTNFEENFVANYGVSKVDEFLQNTVYVGKYN